MLGIIVKLSDCLVVIIIRYDLFKCCYELALDDSSDEDPFIFKLCCLFFSFSALLCCPLNCLHSLFPWKVLQLWLDQVKYLCLTVAFLQQMQRHEA